MKYVYESPDGGHTVYQREIGQTQRTLYSRDKTAQDLQDSLKEIELWKRIRSAAKTNPALQSALDQARMIYELSRND